MGETGFTALLMRSVIGLGIVLAIIAVAYVVMRARGPMGAGSVSGRRARPARSARGSRRRGGQSPIEVVGRAGLTRSSAVVALRFGDRIVLVSASEQGGTSVLAEMEAERWDELAVEREPIDPAELLDVGDVVAGAEPIGQPVFAPAGRRPTFLEALREATTRHA